MAFPGYDAAASASWYAALEKPWFAPPSWVFGPVWTALYVLIAATFLSIGVRVYRGTLPKRILVPVFLNLASNLAFTPLQFGLRSNALALADVLLVLLSLLWLTAALRHPAKSLALWLLPYLLWVMFATVLQLSVTILNA